MESVNWRDTEIGSEGAGGMKGDWEASWLVRWKEEGVRDCDWNFIYPVSYWIMFLSPDPYLTIGMATLGHPKDPPA